MKILVISQHYYPENFRITDIVESLVLSDNDVTVLCGLPNYPKGYIYDGYKNKEHRDEYHHGVHIIRVKEIGRRNNIVFRFLNYWSYAHYGKRTINKLDKDYDVVLVNGLSPIMSALPGIKYAKKYHKPLIMYEMDLWPESLLAGGITHKSIIYKHYKRVSSNIYSKFDKILVSTKEHIDYIKALPKCSSLDIEYLPQYAEDIFNGEHLDNNNDGTTINLMFAGNIGKAQSVDTIIKAANILKDDKRFIFHIAGSGSELDNIKSLVNNLGLSNVIFYGQQPLSNMPNLYSKADVMLVTLEDKEYANKTIPGKIQSYMASGKPIIGSINGSGASFIIDNNLGYVCPSNDVNGLVNIIKNINIDNLKQIGKHAYQVYLDKYNKELFMNTLIATLKGLKDNS